MTIFATGCTGVLGRHLGTAVTPLVVDLADTSEIDTCSMFEANDHLLHLGGIVGEQKVIADEAYALSVNVEGTVRLARSFLNSCEGKFVFVSTSHVYKASKRVLDEESIVEPNSRYAKQKLLAEIELNNLFEHCPDRLIILRLFSILGEGMPDFSLGGAIRKLLHDHEFRIGNCDDMRDFLGTKVAAKALLDVVEAHDLSGTFNLCSGIPMSVRDAVLAMLPLDSREAALPRLQIGNSANPMIVGSNQKLLQKIPWLELPTLV